MKKIWLSLSILAAAGFCGCRKSSEAPAASALNISGTITLDPQLENQTRADDTVFLVARPASGGMPVAVKKFYGNRYPLEFTITSADLMVQQALPQEPLTLSVRVDKDGDASTKMPGDLLGEAIGNPIALNQQGVQVEIREILK